MPEDNLSTGRNKQHAYKCTPWIKINLCYIRMNKGSSFSNEHNGMAYTKISSQCVHYLSAAPRILGLKLERRFKVCKSVHHHTIQINQPIRCNRFSGLLLDVYLQLNKIRTSSRPSSGAQQLQSQPLILPSERGGSSAVGCGRAGRPAGPTTTNSKHVEL